MSLNMDKVRNKLASFDKTKKAGKKLTQEQQERTDRIKKYIWKPEPGKQVVRIVPYQYSPDFPFIELKFYYDFNGDKINYLSPSTINEKDPIVELSNRLMKNRETWQKGAKLQPKLRTYVPIIVRGKEEEGVKFWGFGARVCKQLMEVVNEPEFGDITDLNNGCDITVDFKSAESLNADFPDTTVTPKRLSSPVIDPSHPKVKEILNLITNKQQNILDIYVVASYEELSAALEIKLENERKGINVGSEPRGSNRTTSNYNSQKSSESEQEVESVVEEETVVLPTEEEIESAVPTAVVDTIPVKSPSAQKAKKESVQDIEAALNKLFPSKK